MKKVLVLALVLAVWLLTACSALAPEPTSTPIPPTSTPLPAPTATPLPPSAWRGEWTIWTGDNSQESFITFEDMDGAVTSSEIEIDRGNITFQAVKSEDEFTLNGTWQSDAESGTIRVRLLENQDQFVGNMNGYIPFCGARNDAEMPEACVLNWSGEWQVWLGTDEYNSTVTYVQDGMTVTGQTTTSQGYKANFNGEINADGSIASGGYSIMVINGSFEVIMDDNMIQFSGNYDGQPLCGARWGASKPETCLAP